MNERVLTEVILPDVEQALENFPENPTAEDADAVLVPLIAAEIEATGKVETDPKKTWPARVRYLGMLYKKYPIKRGDRSALRLRREAMARWELHVDSQQAEVCEAPSSVVSQSSASINPFAEINPNAKHPFIKTPSARVRAKELSSADYLAIMRQSKVTHKEALGTVGTWCEVPSDQDVYCLFAGMFLAKVSEARMNEVADEINKKFKAWTKQLLRDCRAVVLELLNNKTRNANDTDAGRVGACDIASDHQDQVNYATAALKRNAENDPKFFRFGQVAVFVERVPETGLVCTVPATKDRLRNYLNRGIVKFMVFGDHGARIVSTPIEVVSDLLASPQQLPIPHIERVCNFPIFDALGNWLATNGYHPSAEAYMNLPDGLVIPEVSLAPSNDEMREALRLLIDEFLGDFPFGGYSREQLLASCGLEPNPENLSPPPDLLSFLAFLLQTMCRAMIGDAPMPALLVTKPTRGTGASLLTETAQMIVEGETATRPPMPESEEERRKTIFADLLGGAAFIFFDNIVGALDSPVLASLLTARVFKDRILSKSESVGIPNKASVVLTGNNPTLSNELQRRVSLCRLDAGTGQPDVDRPVESFKHGEIDVWVSENRGRLLWALATLVRNWIAGGQVPPTGDPLKSYGAWYRVTGGILEAAGLHGFQGNRDRIKELADSGEDDPVTQLIADWVDAAGSRFTEVTMGNMPAEKLAALADEREINLPIRRRRVDQEFKYIPNDLGKFLASHVDRVFEFDDCKVQLRKGRKKKFGVPWSLVVMH